MKSWPLWGVLLVRLKRLTQHQVRGPSGKGRNSCCHSASRQTGFKKSMKYIQKKNPFHGVSYMHQRVGREARKTEIEPDTLKMYVGHAGSMRTNCYLQLGGLCKLILGSHSQTAIYQLSHHHGETHAHTQAYTQTHFAGKHENKSHQGAENCQSNLNPAGVQAEVQIVNFHDWNNDHGQHS